MEQRKHANSGSGEVVPVELIQGKICWVRNRKVILDRDLAQLYGVMTSQLTRQVRRNNERFPDDFMVQLTREEMNSLKCQIGTSKQGRGGTRKLPMAFTELGVAMLSSVLNSPLAIQVNIEIMRAFTKLREMTAAHKDLARKIEDLERKFTEHDEQFLFVFDAIKQLMEEPSPESSPKGPIGFYYRKPDDSGPSHQSMQLK